MSRQQRRYALRAFSWSLFSHEKAPTDAVHGIIPRKVRRDMAKVRFHKSWLANKDRLGASNEGRDREQAVEGGHGGVGDS